MVEVVDGDWSFDVVGKCSWVSTCLNAVAEQRWLADVTEIRTVAS